MQAARIGVYALWLDDDAPAQAALYEPLLPPERQRALCRRPPLARSRSIWTELLARGLLATMSGKAPFSLSIRRDDRGKPYSPDGGGYFSLSHSGAWVACSIGAAESGVDVEYPRARAMDIAARFFRPEERQALADAPPEERAALFLRFWTLKESYLKYTGQGLAGGLQAVDTAALLEGDGDLGGRTFPLPDGAWIGVCGQAALLPCEVRHISLRELQSWLGPLR